MGGYPKPGAKAPHQSGGSTLGEGDPPLDKEVGQTDQACGPPKWT